MAFVNSFRVGADPEFVMQDPPKILNAQRLKAKGVTTKHMFGWDHNGYVVEPHPDPNISVRQVVKNIKDCLDTLAYSYSDPRWRAGAFVEGSPTQDRQFLGLGGHVHLDFPTPSAAQIVAFDAFNDTLVALDILPAAECRERIRRTGYGGPKDCRFEHGHMEYRSMASWLFSRKTSMLAMTGIKLCAVAPDMFTRPKTSLGDLRKFFAAFAPKDDDAKWIIEKEYFETSLEAKSDRDVKSVWKVEPEKGKAMWREGIPAVVGAERRADGTANYANDLVYRRTRNSIINNTYGDRQTLQLRRLLELRTTHREEDARLAETLQAQTPMPEEPEEHFGEDELDEDL